MSGDAVSITLVQSYEHKLPSGSKLIFGAAPAFVDHMLGAELVGKGLAVYGNVEQEVALAQIAQSKADIAAKAKEATREAAPIVLGAEPELKE